MSQKFYPSPSTTTYYIGGVLIDDVYRVDFKRDISHQPIFGYDDARYSFVAMGKELVAGNIIINFRYPGYLQAAINESLKLTNSWLPSIEKLLTTEPLLEAQPVSEEQFKIEGRDLEGITTREERMEVIANKLLEHGFFSNSDLADRLKEQFDRRYLPQGFDAYKPQLWSSPLDGQSDQPSITNFDLSISYGTPGREWAYVRTLKDVVLVGESEVVSASAGAGNDMSSSAQPILEIYPFFARTIESKQNTANTNTIDFEATKASMHGSTKGPHP